MARRPRLKVEGEGAWYHVFSSVSGKRGEYPMQSRVCWSKMLEIVQRYTKAYFCDVGAYAVMGNHYHLVLRFEKPRKVSREELIQRVRVLYPGEQDVVETWSEKRLEQLRMRLFDLSEYMRNIQAAYARWYNAQYRRKGRFWGDRFKSTLLASERAVMDACIYVDLNGLRAGLCNRPEEFKPCSMHMREMKRGRWLLPLSEILEDPDKGRYHERYKAYLYHRGAVPTKRSADKKTKLISEQVLERERARGFKHSGVYLKRFRYFTDGVMVGAEEVVRDQIDRFRSLGRYLRRKNPLIPAEGHEFVLREQRSHFVPHG